MTIHLEDSMKLWLIISLSIINLKTSFRKRKESLPSILLLEIKLIKTYGLF
jgi:hypothetical protein